MFSDIILPILDCQTFVKVLLFYIWSFAFCFLCFVLVFACSKLSENVGFGAAFNCVNNAMIFFIAL